MDRVNVVELDLVHDAIERFVGGVGWRVCRGECGSGANRSGRRLRAQLFGLAGRRGSHAGASGTFTVTVTLADANTSSHAITNTGSHAITGASTRAYARIHFRNPVVAVWNVSEHPVHCRRPPHRR